ncbi:MAG: methyl-accepting chemotaxis protein [Solidesulfovibrio sp.]
MKNTSIKGKLLSIIGIFAVSFTFLALYSYQALRDIVVNGEIYQSITRNKDLIADILPPPAYIIESYATAMDILENRDPAALAGFSDKLRKLQADYEERQAFWKKTAISASDMHLLTVVAYAPAKRFYDVLFREFLPAMVAGDIEKARGIFSNTLQPDYRAHRDVIDRLAGQAAAEVTAIEGHAAEEIATIVTRIAVLGGGIFAAALLFAFYISRQITRPMGKLVHFSMKTSKGVFDEKLSIVQKDELGVLAGHLNVMVGNITRLITEARTKSEEAQSEAANAVQCRLDAESAKENVLQKQDSMVLIAEKLCHVVTVVDRALTLISKQVEVSNEGARTQSYRLEETATAMEEMYATVMEVAQNADLASCSAQEARAKAEEGACVVREVVEDIGAVQTMASALKGDMGRLGEQADGIGRILGVIRDIADQTNLLALNAAIEAARAGESGRGFAVVADEVRKLAEKTMAATGEVGKAIGGIQSETRQHIDNVDKAVSGIETATVKARSSWTTLEGIVALVDAVADQIGSIAAASQQQSAASEEINRAIDGVNRISSDTAQAVSDSVSAIEELREQAAILSDLIADMRSHGDTTDSLIAQAPSGLKNSALGANRARLAPTAQATPRPALSAAAA